MSLGEIQSRLHSLCPGESLIVLCPASVWGGGRVRCSWPEDSMRMSRACSRTLHLMEAPPDSQSIHELNSTPSGFILYSFHFHQPVPDGTKTKDGYLEEKSSCMGIKLNLVFLSFLI